MSFVIFIDGEWVEAGKLSFTFSDPGGCETAQVAIPGDRITEVGRELRILDGLEPLWDGIVEQPGVRGPGSQVGAIGHGEALKRNPFAMIYLDRAMTRWRGISRGRRALQFSGDTQWPLEDVQIAVDESSGYPALKFECSGPIAGSSGCRAEAWYDAGPWCELYELVYFRRNMKNMSGAWNWIVGSGDDDMTVDNVAATVTPITLHSTAEGGSTLTPNRFAAIIVSFASTSANNLERYVMATNIAAVGNHGLDVTPDSNGFNSLAIETIVRDVMKRSGAGFQLDVDAADYALSHFSHHDLTDPEVWLAELAALAGGYHYGTWPGGMLDPRPVQKFKRPPEKATAIVAYRDLGSPDFSDQLSAMHDTCVASWTKADGTVGEVRVETQHPRLDRIEGRVLRATINASSEAAAQTIAAFVLALDQAQSRSTGSCELPAYVMAPGGGIIPSHRLRPGLDRLQVLGLPSSGVAWLSDAAARADTFRIRRIEVIVEDGVAHTRAELDRGADLIETLAARLDLVQQVLGG